LFFLLKKSVYNRIEKILIKKNPVVSKNTCVADKEPCDCCFFLIYLSFFLHIGRSILNIHRVDELGAPYQNHACAKFYVAQDIF